MHRPSTRPSARHVAAWSAALALATAAPSAFAQDCARATACCHAAMDAMHQPHTACDRLASAPPMACAAAYAQFASLTARTGSTPAACGGGGGGGGGSGDPQPPVAPPVEPPGGGPPGGASGSAPPTRWAPDGTTPTRSSQGQVGCQIVRVNGHRAMLTGTTQDLELRCTGIASSAGPPVVANADSTYDHRRMHVRWRVNPSLGALEVQIGGHSTYRAPDSVRGGQAEAVVTATLTIEGPGGAVETVSVPRTMHVINRRLHLDVDAEIVTHCTGAATVTAGFDLTCRQGIDLDVSDSFSVRGAGGRSCGAGNWSGLQACARGLRASVPASARWSLDGVEGQIDPDSGVMTLQITGNRVGYPDMDPGGAAHTVALFPRPLEISPDDGANRSFGSLGTNEHAGAVTAFELHAR